MCLAGGPTSSPGHHPHLVGPSPTVDRRHPASRSGALRSTTADVVLVVDELVSNVEEHAPAG